MKILSFALSIVFCVNTMAATLPKASQLETVIDDYQYALEVEWDQKDMNFYNQKTEEYVTSLSTLVSENEVSEIEILKLLEKKSNRVIDQKFIQAKLALNGGIKNASELKTLIQELQSDMYKEGASWHGDSAETLGYLALIAFVAWVVYAASEKCVERSSEQVLNCSNSADGRSSTCKWENKCIRYESTLFN